MPAGQLRRGGGGLGERDALRRTGRGIALFHRGARFGTDPDALENARDRVFGIAQIESPEAVEAVEQIAAVDGIDVLFVGRATCRSRWGSSVSSTIPSSARRSSA